MDKTQNNHFDLFNTPKQFTQNFLNLDTTTTKIVLIIFKSESEKKKKIRFASQYIA